jgi:pimeloyl-ACP methyl ester carboxylesterase
MPYADNQGVRVYYEVEGEGPPLVLQHGLAGDLQGWRDLGYARGLGSDYRLVLVDARGHGASDKPHAPNAYRLRLMATNVVAALDDQGIDKAHYFGYSMGGYIGWGLAKYAPERLHSLIVSGFPMVHNPDPDVHGGSIPILRQGMKAAAAVFGPMFGAAWTPDYEARFLANDAEALVANRSVREHIDFGDVRERFGVPCLVIRGGDDPMDEGALESIEGMESASLVLLPGLDHVQACVSADQMLVHIRRFLAEVGEG